MAGETTPAPPVSQSWNAGIPCAAATKLADESRAPSLVQAATKSTAVHAGPRVSVFEPRCPIDAKTLQTGYPRMVGRS